MSQVKRPTKKKRSRGVPILGLTLAVLLAVVSFFVAPVLLDMAKDQFPDFKSQIDSFPDDKPSESLPDNTPEYVVAAALWLILMGLFMFLAAVAVGSDPERESWSQMGPSPADKKGMAKQLKKDLKAAKKRDRERKKQSKKKA
jgi:hypothetical protein